jgi:hypothetical protein
MSSVRFQDLRVYQLSEDLADRIWAIVLTWNNFARDTVGKEQARNNFPVHGGSGRAV